MSDQNLKRKNFTNEEKIFLFNETRKGNSAEAIAKQLGAKSVNTVYQARRNDWYKLLEYIFPTGVIEIEQKPKQTSIPEDLHLGVK